MQIILDQQAGNIFFLRSGHGAVNGSRDHRTEKAEHRGRGLFFGALFDPQLADTFADQLCIFVQLAAQQALAFLLAEQLA